jgi:hypothetical protein
MDGNSQASAKCSSFQCGGNAGPETLAVGVASAWWTSGKCRWFWLTCTLAHSYDLDASHLTVSADMRWYSSGRGALQDRACRWRRLQARSVVRLFLRGSSRCSWRGRAAVGQSCAPCAAGSCLNAGCFCWRCRKSAMLDTACALKSHSPNTHHASPRPCIARCDCGDLHAP